MPEHPVYRTVRVHCDSGHLLEPQAEVRRDGPDGEVVVFVVDADAAFCQKCDLSLADEDEETEPAP